jgi:hypothetical protein
VSASEAGGSPDEPRHAWPYHDRPEYVYCLRCGRGFRLEEARVWPTVDPTADLSGALCDQQRLADVIGPWQVHCKYGGCPGRAPADLIPWSYLGECSWPVPRVPAEGVKYGPRDDHKRRYPGGMQT